MNVIELIKKWKIPQIWIANEIGMSRGLFNNKIKNNGKYSYFKKEELEKIKSVLNELKKDIERLE